jgi:hypothetical protein
MLKKKSDNAKKGNEHHNFGRYYNDEERKILSEKNKYYWSKNKFHLKGKKLSNEHKIKLKGRSGMLNPKSKIILDLNTGVYYYSLSEYCKLYNINYDNIKHQLNGRIKNKTSLIYC